MGSNRNGDGQQGPIGGGTPQPACDWLPVYHPVGWLCSHVLSVGQEALRELVYLYRRLRAVIRVSVARRVDENPGALPLRCLGKSLRFLRIEGSFGRAEVLRTGRSLGHVVL